MKARTSQKTQFSGSRNRAGNRLLEILAHKPHRTEHQSWLIVYLDVITLLLAMFILLVTQPQQQFQVEQARIQTEQIQPQPVQKDTTELNHKLADELIKSLDIITGDDIVIQVEPGQVNIQLPEAILFETGKSRLLDDADSLLGKIVPVLLQNDYPISVEGHTDDVPIESPQFPSNWELSTARASMVIRKLVELGVPMKRLKAIGYADTKPLQPNDIEAGRKANRRVNLVIHANNTGSL